jgi:hypothetical protein
MSMSRFDAHDPRDTDQGDRSLRDRPEPSSREPACDERLRPADPLIRPLDERTRYEPRPPGERTHTLDLPTGPHREPVRDRDHVYQLRGTEVNLLETVGRFRAAFHEDVVHATADPDRAREDLQSLVRQDLLAERTITRLSDGRSEDVVSLTTAGKDLLDHHRDPHVDRDQTYYAGWVKTKELWHDATLLRLAQQAAAEVEGDGGRVLRVVLDDELKALVYGDLERERDSRDEPRPDSGEDEENGRSAISAVHHVPLVDGHFQFPDVRLEIETADGQRQDLDLELVTEHYHRGHLGGKRAAGFRLYGSNARSGGTPQDLGRVRSYLR